MNRFSYSLLIIVILALGCRKQDDIYPTVEIISPEAGGTYSYGDTIRVIAQVQQKDGPATVAVLSGDAEQAFGNEKISETDGLITYDLFYTNRYLDGGTYDLRFTAFHGENRSSDFVKINLKPLPRKVTGVAALCVWGGHRALFWQDTTGQSRQQGIAGDYPFFAFNPYHQVAVIAPDTLGYLSGHFLLDEQKLAFSIDDFQPPGVTKYRGLVSSGEYVYVFENQGRVRGLGSSGSTYRNYDLPQGKHLVKVAANDQYLLTAVKEVSDPQHELLLLRKENGAVIKSEKVSGLPLALVSMASGNFAVFLQKGEDTELGVLDAHTGFYTKTVVLPQQKVQAATSTAGDKVVFSTATDIYEFNLKTSTSAAQLYNFAADVLQYDDLHKHLYAAQGSEIKKAQPGSPMAHVATCTGPVINFNLMYNK